MHCNFGFVFTNYNNSDVTKEALSSILSLPNMGNYCIVIVDNNSELNEVEKLKILEHLSPSIKIIFNQENLGYFRGLNVGLEFLKKSYSTFDYVIIGNNDLLFPSDFFSNITKNNKLFSKYPVVSPNIITVDGFHQNPHVIKKISFIREFMYDLYFSNYYLAIIIKRIGKLTNKITGRKDANEHQFSREIYQGHGSCYILGSLFFEKFQSLFAPTFLMGEEFFLSLQLNQKKINIFYECSIIVIHKYHASINKIPKRNIWQISKLSHAEYRKYVKLWKF